MNKFQIINIERKIARLEEYIKKLYSYQDITPEEEFELEKYKAVLKKLLIKKENFYKQEILHW